MYFLIHNNQSIYFVSFRNPIEYINDLGPNYHAYMLADKERQTKQD